MAFPFFLQLFVIHVPKALNCGFAETQFLNSQVLAATEAQRDCAVDEVNDGGAEQALIDMLEQQNQPAGVYSIMASMRWAGGKDADTPGGGGEYWSCAEPVGEVSIARLDARDGLVHLEDMDVDDALRGLLFPGQVADTGGVLTLT